jgi:hypothetical protein
MAAKKKDRKKGAASGSAVAKLSRRVTSLEGFRTRQEKHNRLVNANIAHIYTATKISRPKAFSRLEHTGTRKKRSRKAS